MPLLLVRHAKAGSRQDWDGDDRLRPLSGGGAAQAMKMIAPLARLHPVRLLSSPFTRCVQTFEPLGAALGLDVEQADELGEGEPGKGLVLVRSLADGPTVALCTHGDVVGDVMKALIKEDGLRLKKPKRWPKGSTWVLHPAHGRFERADYIPPPA